MISNLNQSLLEAISLNDRGKDRRTIFSLREMLGIDEFLVTLKNAINKKTNNLISKIELLNEREEAGILSTFDRGLYLHLRVFQENLMIIFPPELVIELTSQIIQQKEYPILSDISLKEITALSYLVVYLLIREKFFLTQRIYLVGANYVAQQFAEDELADKINLKEAIFLKLKFKLLESEYQIVLLLSEKVLLRIKSHLRLTINKKILNQKIILFFNLELKLSNLSLNSLWSIKKGEIIEFNGRNSSWFLRLLKTEKEFSSVNIPIKCVSTKGKKGLQFHLC